MSLLLYIANGVDKLNSNDSENKPDFAASTPLSVTTKSAASFFDTDGSGKSVLKPITINRLQRLFSSVIDSEQIEDNHSNVTIDLEELSVNSSVDLFNSSLKSDSRHVNTTSQLEDTNQFGDSMSHFLNQSVLEAHVEEKEEISGEFLRTLGLSTDDLKLLIVKDKDGRDSMFIDLGKLDYIPHL